MVGTKAAAVTNRIPSLAQSEGFASIATQFGNSPAFVE
jgi:hypothetical protein